MNALQYYQPLLEMRKIPYKNVQNHKYSKFKVGKEFATIKLELNEYSVILIRILCAGV